MFEYKTKTFESGNYGSFDSISDWLNASYKGGFGVKVVGYVSVNQRIVVTILRWKLSEKKDDASARTFPTRTTIDEIPEEPTIHYPEGDLPNEDPI